MIMIGGYPSPIKLNKLIERRAFKEVEGRGLHHPIIIMQQGASKKTSLCENWAWQILLLIMRNPPYFFLTNAGDSFCNSYVYHLVGLHIIGQ